MRFCPRYGSKIIDNAKFYSKYSKSISNSQEFVIKKEETKSNEGFQVKFEKFVFSNEPGRYSNCEMKLKIVSIDKAKQNLK